MSNPPPRRPGTSRALASFAAGVLWTAPWWLGLLLFLAAPLGVSFYLSLCDYTLLKPPVFVGPANYERLAADPVFHQVIWNTLVYAAAAIPLSTALAILLALLLNRGVRAQPFFRACIFVPTVVPLVATGVVWLWMLNPEYGLINQVLRPILAAMNAVLLEPVLGVRAQPPLWLNSGGWAMASLVLVSLWMVGSPVVIYLAALQDIPEQLYEAARLDGASAGRQFWHVTLPGLSPVVLFNVIVAIIGTWQIFALPYVMWRGAPGPERATYFYTMYLFDNAFRYLKLGYASAMGWIQLLIILALTALVFAVSRRAVYYRGG